MEDDRDRRGSPESDHIRWYAVAVGMRDETVHSQIDWSEDEEGQGVDEGFEGTWIREEIGSRHPRRETTGGENEEASRSDDS